VGFIEIALAAKTFVVEKGGSDKILVTDGVSEYVIEHDYNCYDSEFYDGATIYIDSYYTPSYGDKIIIPGYSNTVCEVTSADEVNIKRYYVDNVFDSEDKIIVTDKNGTQFLVEYGLGCGLSMWRYEGKTIDIDIGGSFLDGIGDRIYLFDSGRDCKVWDADELSSSGSYPSGGTSNINELLKSACPSNASYSNGQCFCNEGYVASGNACITYTQNCQNKYGVNSYGDKQYCYCSSGYELNSDKTSCVQSLICPANASKVSGSCVCNEGFVLKNGQCITHTTDCKLSFGEHVIGSKGNAGNSSCNCETGYVWNSTQTACVKIEVKPTQQPQTPVKPATETINPLKENKKELAVIKTENQENKKIITNETATSSPEKELNKESSEQNKQGFFSKIFNSIKGFFSRIFK
jgi:hypothetical protein